MDRRDAALSYDYFFLTTPYHHLAIDSAAQVITVALLLGTGLIASLAGRTRRRLTLEAEEQAGIIHLLNTITRAAATGQNADQLAAEGIHTLLDARWVIIRRGSPNHERVVVDTGDADAPRTSPTSPALMQRATSPGSFGRSTDPRCDGYDPTMAPSSNSSITSGQSANSS